jgi:hypothetical protein
LFVSAVPPGCKRKFSVLLAMSENPVQHHPQFYIEDGSAIFLVSNIYTALITNFLK